MTNATPTRSDKVRFSLRHKYAQANNPGAGIITAILDADPGFSNPQTALAIVRFSESRTETCRLDELMLDADFWTRERKAEIASWDRDHASIE